MNITDRLESLGWLELPSGDTLRYSGIDPNSGMITYRVVRKSGGSARGRVIDRRELSIAREDATSIGNLHLDKVYFKTERLSGLLVSRSAAGTITQAELFGEQISTQDAKNLLFRLSLSKFYFDLTRRKFGFRIRDSELINELYGGIDIRDVLIANAIIDVSLRFSLDVIRDW